MTNPSIAKGSGETEHHPNPTTKLGEVRRKYNVVAVVSSLDEARNAVLALEKAGFSDEISLLGAEQAPDDGSADPDLDSVGKNIATGAATGGVVAGVAGAAASVVIPGIGPAIAAGIWAIAGAGAGGVLGGVQTLGDSPAWRETFAAVESGNVVVGVHSDDPAAVDDASEVLADLDPIALNRFTS